LYWDRSISLRSCDDVFFLCSFLGRKKKENQQAIDLQLKRIFFALHLHDQSPAIVFSALKNRIKKGLESLKKNAHIVLKFNNLSLSLMHRKQQPQGTVLTGSLAALICLT
jgi:hypothetical protein